MDCGPERGASNADTLVEVREILFEAGFQMKGTDLNRMTVLYENRSFACTRALRKIDEADAHLANMKILHYQLGSHGGSETFFVQLVQALHQKGVEQKVVIGPNRMWREQLPKQSK